MSVLGYSTRGNAAAAIGTFLIAAYGAADGTVKQATGPTDKLIGVTELGADTVGQITDIQRNGPFKVRYGGAVARGDYLTSDANGRAVPVAAPGAGVTVHYIGQARVSGVDGDICPIDLSPGVLKG